MAIKFLGGQILFDTSAIAMHDDCCCSCDCPIVDASLEYTLDIGTPVLASTNTDGCDAAAYCPRSDNVTLIESCFPMQIKNFSSNYCRFKIFEGDCLTCLSTCEITLVDDPELGCIWLLSIVTVSGCGGDAAGTGIGSHAVIFLGWREAQVGNPPDYNIPGAYTKICGCAPSATIT